MKPEDIIRWASVTRLDLAVLDGRLVASSPLGPPSTDLLAAIKDQKEEIIHVLVVYPTIRTLYLLDMQRCLPLTPSDLTPDELHEAISLAHELQTAGTTGQFVIDLWHTWHELTPRERVAAVCCWQLAVTITAQEWEAA